MIKQLQTLALTIALMAVACPQEAHTTPLACAFSTSGWDSVITIVYKCQAQAVNFTERAIITSIEGQHTTAPQRTHADVTALHFLAQRCEFFPRDLEKFFGNVEAIAVQNSRLALLTKDDLRGFPKLRSLSLFGNRITTLEFGLLGFSRRLELFSVYGNAQLAHVADDIFEATPDLRFAYFSDCNCVDFVATERESFEILSAKLLANCTPTPEMRNHRELEHKHARVEKNFDELSRAFRSKSSEVKVLRLEVDGLRNLSTATANDSCGLTAHRLAVCEKRLRHHSEDVDAVDAVCEFFDGRRCYLLDLVVMNDFTRLAATMTASEEEDSAGGGDVRATNASDVRELVISGKNVLFLPTNVGELFQSLENLTVVRTAVAKVDEKSLKNLENLRVLDLSANAIEQLEATAFDGLRSLELLDLSRNNLESLCESRESCAIFAKMANLRKLRLDDNRLASLNWRLFAGNKQLEVLSVQRNRLAEISSAFAVGRLLNLDLSENVCVDAKFPDTTVARLIEMFARNCSVGVTLACDFVDDSDGYRCVARDLSADSANSVFTAVTGAHRPNRSNGDVTGVSVLQQRVAFLPQNLESFFERLERLEIVASRLTQVPRVRNLKSLVLTANDIREVPAGVFGASPQLELLALADNKIAKIPANLCAGLARLKVLDLSGNELEEIGGGLVAGAESLREFKASRNRLTRVDSQLVRALVNATVIELTENTCVDNSFDRARDHPKKLMEVYGEVELRCGLV